MGTQAQVTCMGKYITAKAERMGGDLSVVVSGGDAPHLGSVSLGISRKSLTGSGETSATVSTMNMTGHKDDIVGNRFAQQLATVFECRAVVACGIHYDNAGLEDLKTIQNASEELLSQLIELIENESLEDERW